MTTLRITLGRTSLERAHEFISLLTQNRRVISSDWKHNGGCESQFINIACCINKSTYMRSVLYTNIDKQIFQFILYN